jgi:hypothetical protein
MNANASKKKQEPVMEKAMTDKKVKPSTSHVQKIQPTKSSTQTNDPGCRPTGT